MMAYLAQHNPGGELETAMTFLEKIETGGTLGLIAFLFVCVVSISWLYLKHHKAWTRDYKEQGKKLEQSYEMRIQDMREALGKHEALSSQVESSLSEMNRILDFVSNQQARSGSDSGPLPHGGG